MTPSPVNSIRKKTFVAQYESLSHVRDFVGQAAEDAGLDAAAVYAVQMAVDEAFTNIIEHAYGGECLEEIDCTCEIVKDGLEVLLRDCGRPFDPDAVPDPRLDTPLEEREVGGLGLFFIRKLMDEVQFTFSVDESGQQGCNELRMFKRREKAA
ncbi:MAG: ATP-binding protein [Chloroflexi bacterium]|jgi:anti-sigma regulatory factor (Ser/Thr protein kinase)|nr:ATP-binding protein [Chloroflexota bacterium]